MIGTQHKTMGIAAGGGILLYSIVTQSHPELALAAISCPIGSMLPDIDHDSSKIGRVRKKAFKSLTFIAICVVTVLSIIMIRDNIYRALLFAIYGLFAIFISRLIHKNKFIQKQLGFITKHRGIMHTLVPPVVILASNAWCSNAFLTNFIVGLAVGDIIHLIGDMATFDGAPILYPLSKNNFRYFKLKTSEHENLLWLVCYVWCAVFVILGIYFGLKV